MKEMTEYLKTSLKENIGEEPIWKDDINIVSSETRKGVHLKIKDVPESVIDSQPCFYGCEFCGKIYWEGM